jgi:hypothetical protein
MLVLPAHRSFDVPSRTPPVGDVVIRLAAGMTAEMVG